MSNIVGELARVKTAYATPTLTLLHKQTAPYVIAMFRTAFSRDTRTVPAARLHDQVETYLAELRDSGIDPRVTGLAGTGRELCRKWMRDQWLILDTDDDGTEVYTLTSHTQDALALVKDLTRERATLSEHRIATILAAVRRFNTDVNPDRAARVSILNTEIARLAAERNRLVDGGDLPPVSEDYLLEGFTEILSLIGDLPSDFARVEEAFIGLRSEVLTSFRNEARPGDVIDGYLTKTDNLMAATAEGRAFEGAFTLLRDDDLLAQLREDLTALLEHPQSDGILIDNDRRDLRGTVALIRAGIEQVIAQRTRVTATLREYIVTHDTARDRELDDLLRNLDNELATWMQTAGPRAAVPLPLLPLRTDVAHLKQRFYDPLTEAPPPPLDDTAGGEPEPLALATLRSQGGPTIGALRDALHAAFDQYLDGLDLDADTAAAADVSLGDVFNRLDPELRRPVEVFGLLHLGANHDHVTRLDTAHETYVTLRPDGTERRLEVPRWGTPVAPPTGAPATGAHDGFSPEATPTDPIDLTEPPDLTEPVPSHGPTTGASR